jgi:serine/threonine protein kinase
MPSEDAPPRVLADRFELQEVLGTGGMATVWSALDRRLGRTVAVKVLRPDLSDEHAHRVEREARAAARIVDPRVVTVLDLEHDADGTPFLVLEALEGRTLADELRDGPLPLPRALRLADDLLGGLAAAHACGVLHRDVKPSNILLSGDGYRVTDFGIASLDDDATEGDLVGTLLYVAPERFDGAPASPRTDVFSAAAVIYEALTGGQPFRDDGAAASLGRLRSGGFEPLPSRVPTAMARAVTMGLDPVPERRPVDAVSFADLVSAGPQAATEPVEVVDATTSLDDTSAFAREPVPASERTAPVASPEPATSGPPTSVLPNRVAAPKPPAPKRSRLAELRDDPRTAAFVSRMRKPQTIFIGLAVVLLLALLLAAAIGPGDDGTTTPRPGQDGAPVDQLDENLDRIEEIGR